jgi:hypothetical protein
MQMSDSDSNIEEFATQVQREARPFAAELEGGAGDVERFGEGRPVLGRADGKRCKGR